LNTGRLRRREAENEVHLKVSVTRRGQQRSIKNYSGVAQDFVTC